MKLRIFLLILLAISVLLELVIFSFPLVFLLTYTIFAIDSKPQYLIIAGTFSLLGDAVLNLPMGATLLSVTLLNIAVLLYARFLGSKDALVYVLIGVIGVFLYAIIFGYSITSLFNWFIFSFALWIVYRLIPKRFLQL